MIQTILDSIFMFNADLSKSECERIEQQINTLKSLYITNFDVFLVPSKNRTFKTQLYEDPAGINILCPFEVEDEAITEFGISIGLLNRTQYGYDVRSRNFRLEHTISELIEMFSGNETLIFIEYTHD